MREAWITLVLVAVLALAACGSGDSADDTPPPGAATQTTQGMAHGGAPANTSCSPSGNTVSIVASNTTFSTDCLAAPANQALTVSYENKDPIGHNLVFLDSHTATSVMFRADIFAGPATKTFATGPFPPGTYAYHCEVHPNQMSGTLVVK